MKKIKVTEIKKGDRFTKPLYLDKSTVFLPSQTPVTEGDLERLKKFNIIELYCDGEKVQPESAVVVSSEDRLPFLDSSEEGLRIKLIYDKITHNRHEFESLHRECSLEIQQFYKLVADGKSFEIQKFRSVAEKMVDFTKANSDIIGVYLNTLPQTSNYLPNHVTNATFYSLMIASILEWSRPRLIDLCLGSLMADIGMVFVNDFILSKPTQLDENELREVKKHTLVGYQVLTQKIKVKHSLAVICLQHHENYDGSGYPQKLSSNSIEEFARVYAIGDTYSALVSKRPHRKPYLPHQAIKMMIGELINRFDLRLVKLFLNTLSMYPLGSYVELSDGRIGMVIESNPDKPIRPTVRILKESNGQSVKTLQFSNLSKDTQIFISSPVDPSTL